jgi:hypothetical protein
MSSKKTLKSVNAKRSNLDAPSHESFHEKKLKIIQEGKETDLSFLVGPEDGKTEVIFLVLHP